MPYTPIDNLEKVTVNRYEAVIVAALRARQINTRRLIKLAAIVEAGGEVEFDMDARKITMVALKELMDGKVKFDRADTE
jgi:DNA-directed RNA polymerase omega subunit